MQKYVHIYVFMIIKNKNIWDKVQKYVHTCIYDYQKWKNIGVEIQKYVHTCVFMIIKNGKLLAMKYRNMYTSVCL